MGQNYLHSAKKVIITIIFCLLFSTISRAQALSGTYTIGSSGADYASFTDAVKDLVSKGVQGPVVFKVAKGNYNETITIPAISGSSSTNTITFTGAGISSGGTRLYYALANSGSAVIFLNGCSYITLDHMTVENTSTSTQSFGNYPASISTRFDTFTTISYCNIKTAVSTGIFYNFDAIHLYNSLNGKIINSRIAGGLFGLLNEGFSKSGIDIYGNLLVKNSRFTGAYYNHVYGYGYPKGLQNDVYDGNSFDSSTSPYISAYQLSYENGAVIKNNVTDGNVASYLPIEIDYPNFANDTFPFMIYNNMIGNFQYQGIFIDGGGAAIPNMNMYVLHNTIDEEDNKPSEMVFIDLTKSGGLTFEDNILSTSSNAIPFYLKIPKSPSGIKVDGNNYYNTGGGALITLNKSSYSSLAIYKGAVSSLGWSLYDNNIKPHFSSKRDLHLDQAYLNPSGVFAGIKVDIDSDSRCTLFPTAGADESTYGTGNPVVKFYLPATIFPNSPTYVTQIAKPGEAKRHSWYVNGVHVSDSIVLLTDKFNVGSNTLKLITITCFGSDSFSQTFNVSAPTSVPLTDFIADKNNIRMGDVVSFQDLTTGGPTRWQWTITPDSIVKGGIKVPAIQYVYGNPGFGNIRVQFNAAGNYRVCLATYNIVGKGATVCKKDYILVSPAYNLGTGNKIVHDARGFIYDNGGPFGDYSYDSKLESILIDPCADSVFLTFSSFDMYCGYDYLRIYEGRDNSGKNISGKCTTIGSYSGYGKGFTGGKAYPGGCVFQCMPNVIKPDTFAAKNSIYLEMNCYAAYQSAGFAAYWWSKPRVSYKAKAAFTVSSDSVCTSQNLTFINTTKTDPSDPPTFLWDLDGDPASFECIGACTSIVYPYYIPGPVTILLIATNCGGADTASYTITAYDPDPPIAKFQADNTTPTTSETVFFTSLIPVCVDNFRWAIRNNNPIALGKAVYINATDSSVAAPQVNFTDTGYYDVSLFAENMGGLHKDSVTIQKYIHVRAPYCIPAVDSLNADIGIYKVEFNAISKTGSQGLTAYSNFVNNSSLSTTVAKELTYSLNLYRKYNPNPTPINRTVWIDWNGDGKFSASEVIASDSNSTSTLFTRNIYIPKSAREGATIMRVAVNKGNFSNKPCGRNEFGEYQDFRIYITPYNIAPVITLTGKQGLTDTIIFDIGHNFNEPGYRANSQLYGDISQQVVRTSLKTGSTNPADSFNKYKTGFVYIFSYNVTDASGNKAVTKYRIVKLIKDITPPDLIVEKPDTLLIAVTPKPVHPVYFPKVISSIDLIDGARSVKIDTPDVFTNITGNYIVTYTSTDASGNTIRIYRVIKVIDSIKPILVLNGASPFILGVFQSFTDPGIQFSDNYYSYDTLALLLKINSNLDTSKTGNYTMVYSITDPSGNKDSVTRIIKVVDTIKPVIKLSGLFTDSVEVFKSYTDPGYILSDNYDAAKDLSITIGGTFITAFGTKNPDITGVYTIVYSVKDKSGNTGIATRNVKVQDRTAPQILLTGNDQVVLCRWAVYHDSGYTLTDNYDNAPDIRVDTFGTWFTKGGTNLPNYLYIQYRATDKSGNITVSLPRIIKVKSQYDVSCISGISPDITPERYFIIYPNPGNGKFTIKALGNEYPVKRIIVRNSLGQVVLKSETALALAWDNTMVIDITNELPGIYFAELQTGNSLLRFKIEIVR